MVLQNVTVLGCTAAGKTSLIRTLKARESRLTQPEERTVVLENILLKLEDVQFQIIDFGGHSVYELTCPLFLQSNTQICLVVVNSTEYTNERHDDLVTKWLKMALSHMTEGHVAIVLAQCDLIEEDVELANIKATLAHCIETWKKKELDYIQMLSESLENKFKASGHHQNQRRADTNFQKTFLKKLERSRKMLLLMECVIICTSSKTQSNTSNLLELLVRWSSKKSACILPGLWANMVTGLMNPDLAGNANYMSYDQAQQLYAKCVPLYKRVFSRQDSFEACLKFLHNSGILLWFHDRPILHDIIFHEPAFIVSSLQCLFHHNLKQTVQFSTRLSKFVSTKTEFDTSLDVFLSTGVLSPELLYCIWTGGDIEENMFDKMGDILKMLELCFEENGILHFPWFIQVCLFSIVLSCNKVV